MFKSRIFAFSKKEPEVSVSFLPTSNTSSAININEKKSLSATLLSTLSFGLFPARQPPTWHPNALRPSVLSFSILLSLSLIATLQCLLLRSQHDQGIQFAPKISALPLRQTFLWQYFPILVAVVFSIFWAWIDLETKRLEPYYQLSKKEGALGKDSLLLRYPFDFVPLVPMTAARKRHWPVFFASTAVVLITWGIVPTQAGIFSTERVTRTFPAAFEVSTGFLPASEQEAKLTLRYAQSTYGIVMLNQTLPPYMTRNYILAPFRAIDVDGQEGGTWTAPTTLYSLDMECETATQRPDPTFNNTVEYSGMGCQWPQSLGLTGNSTIGKAPSGTATSTEMGYNVAKEFSATYVGYWNLNGFADYYLDGYCSESDNHTFYAAFTRNKKREEDPPNKLTSIFCRPSYYSQQVNATIDVATKKPLDFVPLSPKQQLALAMFNSTSLEAQFNGGSAPVLVRGDSMPDTSIPTYQERVAGTELSLVNAASRIPPLAALAALVDSDVPLEKYTDAKTLGESYEKAYRLLFANAMVEILDQGFTTSNTASGQRQLSSEAVVLEPVFTYIVEALLAIVAIATVGLLYLSVTRERHLRSDPSTIASVMSLVADNTPLLSDLQTMDCCTIEEVEQCLSHRRWKLVNNEFQTGILEVNQALDGSLPLLSQRQDIPKEITKPVRPKEFRLVTAIPFIGLFIVLAVSLAVLFVKARPNGLPLPSNNRIVQNVLENYIPTALATLIEPMWVLINRLLAMLQPLEELQNCRAPAKKSIDLNYGSLPPQLLIYKAARSGHFVLAAVCTMALLANLLAISFAGLFNQDAQKIWNMTTFSPPFEPKFVAINGSIGPGLAVVDYVSSGAFHGGSGEDQNLIFESNYSRGTPLPVWTDEKLMYLPIFSSLEGDELNGTQFEASTTAFGAEFECEQLSYGTTYHAKINTTQSNETRVYSEIPVSSGSTLANCFGNNQVLTAPATGDGRPRECAKGPVAAELITHMAANQNATQKEKDICMGSVVLAWIRDPNGACGSILNKTLDASNSLFVRCQPRLVVGTANVLVDARGQLQKKADIVEMKHETNEVNNSFTNDAVNLFRQANLYLLPNNVAMLHNDTFTTDNFNYFVGQESNSRRLVDPSQGTPTFDEVYDSLKVTYSRLFAIWLGVNKENLLVSSQSSGVDTVSGWTIETTERLFLSTVMFAIAEGIICTYIVVAIMVYLRRPGKYLARLPICIASIVALFAASAAIQDMKRTSRLDKRERAEHLANLGSRYGYGSYVGSDGKVHIGIEKVPFVRARKTSTWFEKKAPSSRSGPRV